MATLQTDARLFGLDLSGLGSHWVQALQAMGHWPVFNWLKPRLPVRVVMPSGAVLIHADVNRPLPQSSSQSGAAFFEAVVLPEDLVLRKRIVLPHLPPSEAQAALELAVQSQSPFSPEQLLWASRPTPATGSQAMAHDVVLTARNLVQTHLEATRNLLLNHSQPPEVWADAPNAAPYVCPGFGESQRLRRLRRGLQVNVALCLLAFCLLVGIGVSPTLQLRLRALDALDQHARLQQEVAPVLGLREGLVKAEEQLQALADVAGAPVSAVQVLDLVTRALPDDTALLNFALNATESPGKPPKVVLTGNTMNAAALMQKLSGQPGLRDVKALTAATKPLGADKESFSIEATLDLANIKP